MPTLEELQQTPRWMNASPEKQTAMLQAWNSADEGKRTAFLEAAKVPTRSPQPVTAPEPTVAGGTNAQGAASPPAPVATPTPSPAPQPSLFEPAPGREQKNAPWFVEHFLVPALAGAGSMGVGAGLAKLAPQIPRLAQLGAEGLSFAGMNLAGRRTVRDTYGVEQNTPLEEVANVALDTLAPAVGEKIVQPVLSKIARGGKRAFGAVMGTTARANEVRDVMTPLQQNADLLGVSLKEEVADDLRRSADEVLNIQKAAEANVRKTAALKQREDVRNLIGPDPKEVARVNAPVGTPEGVLAERESVAVYENLVNEVQEGFGKRFEDLVAPHFDDEVPKELTEHLGELAQEALERAKNFKVAPTAMGKLREIAKYAPKPSMSADASQEALLASTRFGRSGNTVNLDVVEEVAEEAPKALRVGDLIALKGELRPLMTDLGPTRHVAKELSADVTDVLSEMGLVDPKLNALYRDWRKGFDRPTMRKLWNAQRATELEGLFKEPKLTRALLANATPEQKDSLRKIVTDIASRYELNFKKLGRIMPPDVARELFGARAADVTRWDMIDLNLDNLERLYAADPSLKAMYEREVQRGAMEVYESTSRKIRDRVAKAYGALGTAGERAGVQLQMTPLEDAMRVSSQTVWNPRQAFDPLLEQSRREIPIVLGHKPHAWYYERAPFYGTVSGMALLAGGYPPQYAAAAMLTGMGALGAKALRTNFVKALESPTGEKFFNLLSQPMTRATLAQIARLNGRVIASEGLRESAEYLSPREVSAADVPPTAPLGGAMAEDDAMARAAYDQGAGRLPVSDAGGFAGGMGGGGGAGQAPMGMPATPQGAMGGNPLTPPSPQPPPSAPPAANPNNVLQPQGVPSAPPSAPPRAPMMGGGAPSQPLQPSLPPAVAAQDELSRLEIHTPKFTKFHLGGFEISNPRLVNRYQQLVNDGIEQRVAILRDASEYRNAPSDVQARMVRRAIEMSKKSALGVMRPEIGRQLKRDSMEKKAKVGAPPFVP